MNFLVPERMSPLFAENNLLATNPGYPHHMSPYSDICSIFRDALHEKLQVSTLDEFRKAWESVSNKTRFYESFFKRLSDDLGYTLFYEEFRCDYTMKNTNGYPMVLIESENDHKTATTEVEQLLRLVAPVKMLVLSCEWHDSQREVFLKRWIKKIKEFNDFFPTDSIFCFWLANGGEAHHLMRC
jgi:hypothetical protein